MTNSASGTSFVNLWAFVWARLIYSARSAQVNCLSRSLCSLEKIDERTACLYARFSFFPCFGIICNVPTQPISCARSQLPTWGQCFLGFLNAQVYRRHGELCGCRASYWLEATFVYNTHGHRIYLKLQANKSPTILKYSIMQIRNSTSNFSRFFYKFELSLPNAGKNTKEMSTADQIIDY